VARTTGGISFLSGFSSFSHISRSFRQAYGCSPREYRARLGDRGA
jgi:AraC family transcriptional regulator, positive regulator of tynA and feaB